MASSISLLVPIAYIVLLVGSLLVFSRVYRKRTAARISNQEPWFPSHPERDVYISLLQLDPPPSDVLLKAALLRRAVTDVQRILTFREDKAALQALLQKGSIGDDLWTAFLAAEKELEAEIIEVVNEANSFREGWGQFIFQSASEVANNLKHRELFASIQKRTDEARAKYGTPKSPSAKMLASQLASSLPATPKPGTPIVRQPKQNGAASSTASKSSTLLASPSPSSNGDPTASPASAGSSPKSQSPNLPKSGPKRNRKRK